MEREKEDRITMAIDIHNLITQNDSHKTQIISKARAKTKTKENGNIKMKRAKVEEKANLIIATESITMYNVDEKKECGRKEDVDVL